MPEASRDLGRLVPLASLAHPIEYRRLRRPEDGSLIMLFAWKKLLSLIQHYF